MMKKLIISFLFSLLFFASYAQFPNRGFVGNLNTETYDSGARGTYIGLHLIKRWADTTSLNSYSTGFLKNIDGFLVRVGNNLYMRNIFTNTWDKMNGGSGGGNTNSNIGAGFRWALPNTNNIKTVFNSYAFNWDSTSNANGLTPTIDTGLLATIYRVDSSIAVAEIPLNNIAPATGNNTIDNGGTVHQWKWDALGGNTAFSLTANTTGAASNFQRLFSAFLNGANSNSNQTTYAGLFSNTHTGTGSTNIGASFAASGGTNNYAILAPTGNVGIGTLSPTATFHNKGSARFEGLAAGAGIYAARLDANGNMTYAAAPLTGNNCFDIVINGGADSTGVSDVAPIFQAAINAGYKCITIPVGKFNLASTVFMKDSVTIQGQGNSSVLKITGNHDGFKCRDLGAYSRGTYTLATTPDGKVDHGTASYVIGSGGGGYNTKFLNFAFLGDRSATTAQNGIYLDTVNTVIVDKVTALNLGGFMTVVNRNGVAGEFVSGLLMMENATRGVRITNCYAQYCYGGVALDTTAEYNIVTNNTLVNNVYGVFDRGANNIISNNNLSTNFYGLRALFHSSNNGHSTINGNTINHCNHSIWLTGLTFGYYMADNDIYSEDSIVIENCTRVSISGGYIFIQATKPFVMNNNTSLALIDVGKLIGITPTYSVTGNPPTVTQTGKVDNAISLIDVVNNKQVDVANTNGLFSVTLNGAASSVKAGVGTTAPDSTLTVTGGFHSTGGVRLDGIPVGTTTDSAMVYNTTTKTVGYKAFPSGGGTGTVTSVGVTDGSGFDLTVTNPTTTPNISLTTSLTAGSVPYIGASGALSQNNSNFFWNNSTTSLGIGTNSPAAMIHVSSAGGAGMGLRVESSSSSSYSPLDFVTNAGLTGQFLQTGSAFSSGAFTGNQSALANYSGSVMLAAMAGSGYVNFVAGANDPANEVMRITANLRVGIGVTSPSAQLHTTSTVRFANFGAGAATFDASGNVSSVSDERYKTNINFSHVGLKEIMKLRPINYKWNSKSGMETEHTYTGFSAQNVKAIIPNGTGENKEGYLTLQDRAVLAAAIVAIQDLKKIIDKQQKEINRLKKKK